MNSFIDKLFESGKYGDKFVISVPISLITNKEPIFKELWEEFKGMCNYGTNGLHQTRLINQIIQNDRYLSKFRR